MNARTSDSIGPERRHKRRGAPGDTGHLVACPLAGGASSWLGWVTAGKPKLGVGEKKENACLIYRNSIASSAKFLAIAD
jgi:hypothetical protein